MVCVVTASMRGASLHSSNLTGWRYALCVAHLQHTLNEKVGFFTYYLYRLNAGDLVLNFHYIKGPVPVIVANLDFCLGLGPSQNLLVCNLRIKSHFN